MTVHCKTCGNSNIRTSHQKEPTDAAEALNGKTPYRCRECRTRFYAEPSPAGEPAKTSRRSQHRNVRTILKRHKRAVINSSIFLLLFGLFVLCLLYLVNYHPGTELSLIYAVRNLLSV